MRAGMGRRPRPSEGLAPRLKLFAQRRGRCDDVAIGLQSRRSGTSCVRESWLRVAALDRGCSGLAGLYEGHVQLVTHFVQVLRNRGNPEVLVTVKDPVDC